MPDIATERWSDRTIDSKSALRTFEVPASLVGSNLFNAQVYVALNFGCEINAPHPWNPFLRVTSDGPLADQTLGFPVYKVSVKYALGPAVDPTPPGPLQIQWDFGSESVESDVDVDGNPVFNTAGDVFGKLFTRTDALITLDVFQDILPAQYDAARAIAYANSSNSDQIGLFGYGTAAPGQVRCVSIAPAGQYAPSAVNTYIKQVYKFELKAGTVQDSDGVWDAFRARMISVGNNGWYSNSGTATFGRFWVRGKPTLNVRLQQNGIPFDPNVTVEGNAPISTPTDNKIDPKLLEIGPTATFMKYHKCKQKPFAALGIF